MSIEAALNPDSTDYIFFVADGTGGHAFAVTLEEHNANVAKWRAIEAEQKAQPAAEPLPVDALRRKLAGIVFEDALWPYMRIWLEVASRAAMGDPFYRAVGEQIGRGFLEWGKMQLQSDNDAQREIDAAQLLVSIEGMLFLKSIGLDDINAKAL